VIPLRLAILQKGFQLGELVEGSPAARYNFTPNSAVAVVGGYVPRLLSDGTSSLGFSSTSNDNEGYGQEYEEESSK